MKDRSKHKSQDTAASGSKHSTQKSNQGRVPAKNQGAGQGKSPAAGAPAGAGPKSSSLSVKGQDYAVKRNRRRIVGSPFFIDGLILAAIFAVAFCLRAIPLQQAVFGSGFVNFQGPDPWYHVRLIENLVHHFPARINFDPYTYYPYGQDVWFAPFYDWLVGFFAWAIGGGSPGLNTVYTIAAYSPVVIAALVSIPVYFIGKVLFNRKVGLLAALIAVILPSPFLDYSVLGSVSHHVPEILFSTTAILFLVLALKQVQETPISFENIRRGEWKIYGKPLIYALLSGFFLGVYLLTWVGGLLIVFLFFCLAVIMYIINHLKRESTDYLCILCTPIFLIALLMIIPFLDQLAFSTINVVSLLIGVLIFPILSGISRLMEYKGLRPFYYPVVIVGLSVIGLVGFYSIDPSQVGYIMGQFQVFNPSTSLMTITEARPLFFIKGPFSLGYYWSYFTTTAVIAPIGFILILIAVIKKIETGKVLLLIWGLMMFLATMSQIRFGAYLTVCFALLGSFFIWKIVEWIPPVLKYFGFKAPQESRKEKERRKKEQAKLARAQQPEIKADNREWMPSKGAFRYVYIGLAVILVFFLGIFPSIQPAAAAASVNSGVTQDWYNALIWMKDNTPEPFQNANFFNELYTKPAGGVYQYPASAYGVMSWWDFGNYITDIAHRIPNANPNQSGAAAAAAYFTAQDEQAGNKMLDQSGSKYVIIDLDMATPLDSNFRTQMFADIANWANGSAGLSPYCEIYFSKIGNNMRPVTLYYPAYYQTMISRLFNFHGEAVTPTSTMVISYQVESGYKVIQSSQTFPTYEEAQAFVDSHPSGNYRIVGTSQFVSPVPLEKLDHYQEVYQGQLYQVGQNSSIKMPGIQIFKYTP